MKLTKTAGKTTLSVTRQEWERIGAAKGWTKPAATESPLDIVKCECGKVMRRKEWAGSHAPRNCPAKSCSADVSEKEAKSLLAYEDRRRQQGARRMEEMHKMLDDMGLGRKAQTKVAARLSAEELATTWEEDKDGEYIQVDDDNNATYVAHGTAMEKIPKVNGETFVGIREWMNKKNFWPNIWSVNERGNVTLRGYKGQDLGGLV